MCKKGTPTLRRGQSTRRASALLSLDGVNTSSNTFLIPKTSTLVSCFELLSQKALTSAERAMWICVMARTLQRTLCMCVSQNTFLPYPWGLLSDAPGECQKQWRVPSSVDSLPFFHMLEAKGGACFGVWNICTYVMKWCRNETLV